MLRDNLILLRGNSGSGKTTIAKRLQKELGRGTMLVSQDVVRREMLKVEDKAGNPAIELTRQLVMYGNSIDYDVVLEGIFSNKKYGEMMQQLVREWNGTVFAYYFDLPFEETVKHHASKPNAHEFSETEMRQWWKDKDYLGIDGEKIITSDQTEDEIVAMIRQDIS